MRKTVLASVLVAIILLSSQVALYASYGLNVIENDSIGVIYFNLSKAYNVVRDQVKNFDKTADPNTRQQIEQVLGTIGTENPLAKDYRLQKSMKPSKNGTMMQFLFRRAASGFR